MCARKAEREQKPDSKTRATQDFAWQHFDVIDEKAAIKSVAEFLYPDEVLPDGHPDKTVTERVRIAVSRAREKELILPRVSNAPNTLFVKNFISWACTHWPSLQTVIPTRGATFQLFAPKPMLGSITPPEAFELKLPKGEFPIPVKLSQRSMRWVECEIATWIVDRISATRAGDRDE